MIRKVVRKPALSSQEEPWVREETWKLKVVLNSKLRGQCFSWGSVEPLKVIEGVYFIIVTVCRWMQVRAPCNGTDEMVRGGGSWRGRCKCETSLSGCWPPVGISVRGKERVKKYFSPNRAVTGKKALLQARCLLFSVTVYFL
jgi:hypothetical protein